MEQPRLDVDSANFRITIITSFVLGATMIDLSLNVSIIKQSATTGLMGTTEWLLAVSIALMLFAALIMLFMSYVILATMYLIPLTLNEKLESRMGQNPPRSLVNSDPDVLRVHLSRQPRTILTMVLASWRYRIRQWNPIGNIERLLPDQVRSSQTASIPNMSTIFLDDTKDQDRLTSQKESGKNRSYTQLCSRNTHERDWLQLNSTDLNSLSQVRAVLWELATQPLCESGVDDCSAVQLFRIKWEGPVPGRLRKHGARNSSTKV